MAASTLLQNSIRNTLRSITINCTLPQQKAVKELLVGIMREGTTVINCLADTGKKVRVGKQSERLRRHLGTVDLRSTVEAKVSKALPEIAADTIVAYDLSDIAKPAAKKMEGLAKVFDGSKRKPVSGYAFHGVSIGNQPLVMRLHDSDAHTLNQTRLEVIEHVLRVIGKKGIWVFDRGNDDRQFFTDLTERGLRFVARLRCNRHLIVKETGEILAVEAFLPGEYRVILPKSGEEYTLVVQQRQPSLQPIRVLTNVAGATAEWIVAAYLERWDVENLFRQMKLKYDLESIRVLSLDKIKNLLALVQMVTSLNNSLFEEVQQEANEKSPLSLSFSRFCSYRSLSRNRFSFSSFVASITPDIQTAFARPAMPSLFSWRQLGKMGVF